VNDLRCERYYSCAKDFNWSYKHWCGKKRGGAKGTKEAQHTKTYGRGGGWCKWGGGGAKLKCASGEACKTGGRMVRKRTEKKKGGGKRTVGNAYSV